jgi:tryptophan 2,3-dioxygenase
MTEPSNQRPLEDGITTDFTDRMSYGGYLRLDRILSAQHPLSDPPVHDETLFIIQHQTSELWMKLVIHELRAALVQLREDDLGPCQKMLARIKHIQKQLTEQWSVLETLTPSDYMQFRSVLGASSGFQSHQYREIEFLLGNKNAHYVKVFDYDPDIHRHLTNTLNAPSLYDEFLRHLSRRGHAIPAECLNRDWSQPYERREEVVVAFERIYENTEANWEAYHFCEQLVDIEVNFQQWRFRHLKTVERIIGYKPGTGGSSGVAFLKKALDLSFFPELFEVRTRIG